MASRTPESMIRAAVLHPVEEIRTTALAYFSQSHTQDETIMPLVIEAVKKYGRATAFGLLRGADNLPQTKATTRWLLDELFSGLDWASITDDNYGFALALILCDADLDQWAEPIDTIVDHPEFPEELKDWPSERLAMRDWDWATGWRELESLGLEICESGELLLRHQRRGQRIIEALARHSDKGPLLLPLLRQRYHGYDRELMECLECFLIELAGQMRLEAAVPILIERLQEDDIWLGNSCTTALQWINSDAVARAIADAWPTSDSNFRRSASEILEKIHTDFSVKHLVDFFNAEKDDDTKQFLANAILGNFLPEAVPLIRPMVLGNELTPDENDLRLHLVAASAIMGVTFPEYDTWFDEGENGAWGWGKGFDMGRIRESFREADEEDFTDEEEFDDAEGFLDDSPTVLPFHRDAPPVGRNDPCPCGSGKKYKKCCLGKQSPAQQEAPPRYPIGAVVLYGPDANRTTKITASVIKREDAEPILQRWVGSKVTDNPKVRRGIQEFFNKHGVKSVVATDRNMGCPHEEGEDFPIGGDCPFCPYWKGKQGSGATE